jgi:hypothetical protein
MRILLVALALSAVACDSSVEADDVACGPTYPCGLGPADAMLADVRVNEAGDAALAEDAGCGGQCGLGQICSYDPGCASPTKSCHPDTGGDAVALAYCGCDGNEFTTSQLFPTQPYENAGHCSGDGGGDASDADAD